MSSIVDIGSAKLNQKTGMVTAQCKGAEREDGEAEDFGDTNMAFALGFAAVPAPANDDGNPEDESERPEHPPAGHLRPPRSSFVFMRY